MCEMVYSPCVRVCVCVCEVITDEENQVIPISEKIDWTYLEDATRAA